MPITFSCTNPECPRIFSVKDEFAGRTSKCPDCGTSITVPVTQATPIPVLPVNQATPQRVGVPITGKNKKLIFASVAGLLFLLVAGGMGLAIKFNKSSSSENNVSSSSGMLESTMPEKNVSTLSGKIDVGYDFSDGVAWVYPSGGPWQCVDKKGKPILTLTDKRPFSNFSHGVASVSGSGPVELIDKKGKIISSPKSGEYDRIVGFIRDIGMTLVYKHIDTFQLTEDQVGVIDCKGNWQVHLTNNLVLVTATRGGPGNSVVGYGFHTMSPDDDIVQGEKPYLGSSYYCGGGVFTLGSNRDMQFFNIFSGNNRTFSDWNDVDKLKRFEKGYGVFMSGNTVYKIDESGNTTVIFESSLSYGDSAHLGEYSDGLFYFAGTKSDGQYAKPPAFYDISGKKIIDLSKYKIRAGWSQCPIFLDGYCVLNLSNPQGVGYYTIIDKSGKEMFEPRQSPSGRSGYGGYDRRTEYFDLSTKCGMVVIAKNRIDSLSSITEYGSWTIINAAGDTIAEFGEGYTISDYSEDVALVKFKGQVGHPAETYYIDKNGKRMF